MVYWNYNGLVDAFSLRHSHLLRSGEFLPKERAVYCVPKLGGTRRGGGGGTLGGQ